MESRECGSNNLYACPCCGYATLDSVAEYDICPICFWEDDGQDDNDKNKNYGGPNKVSLYQARINFFEFGAAEEKDISHVRVVNSNDIDLRMYIIKNGKIVSAKNS